MLPRCYYHCGDQIQLRPPGAAFTRTWKTLEAAIFDIREGLSLCLRQLGHPWLWYKFDDIIYILSGVFERYHNGLILSLPWRHYFRALQAIIPTYQKRCTVIKNHFAKQRLAVWLAETLKQKEHIIRNTLPSLKHILSGLSHFLRVYCLYWTDFWASKKCRSPVIIMCISVWVREKHFVWKLIISA